jgi:hypothetical protein
VGTAAAGDNHPTLIPVAQLQHVSYRGEVRQAQAAQPYIFVGAVGKETITEASGDQKNGIASQRKRCSPGRTDP